MVHTDILLLYSTVVPSLWSYWIYIYRYLLLSLVVSCDRPIVRSRLYLLACGCIACLLLVSWYLLSTLVACRCSDSCRLLRLLSVTCLEWPPPGPRGYLQATRHPTLRGGDFSKRGEGQTETSPVPIFMRKVKKNVVFQRKTGEIQRKTGYEERRKRKSRSRDRGYEGEVTVNGAGQTDKKQSGLTL